MNDKEHKSGFISLIGRPNTGKSTLLNQLAGMPLAITSPKPQTTRTVIRAILNRERSQMVFLDTPGMHQPKTKLGNSMRAGVRAAVRQGDVLVILIDAVRATAKSAYDGIPRVEAELIRLCASRQVPVILAINKVDRAEKEHLLPLIDRYRLAHDFVAILPLSARTGDGVQALIELIEEHLPQGPRLFPEDMHTDQTEKGLAAELIREQILYHAQDEIPHGTAVGIEEFRETFDETQTERRQVSIHAVIYCEKSSHKGILIGKQGAMLKKIGSDARQRIEQMLDCPCYLELFVKVREDWRNRPGMLRNLGLEGQE